MQEAMPRFEMNGTAAPRGKGKGRARATTASRSARIKTDAARRAVRWAHAYTGASIAVSAGLNAYSAVTESGQTGALAVAAGAIGAFVPLSVWMLCKVSAWTYRAGWRKLACIPGAVAACVLALSVVHVASALSALTGTGAVLAFLLAIGVDCGLMASEATAIMVSETE